MIAPVLAAVIPVLVVAGIGLVWVRAWRNLDNAMLTPLVVDVGTPCLILATFLKTRMTPESFAEVAVATITALIAFSVLGYIVLRLLSFRVRTFLPSLTFPNNGNLGLPWAAYAFGAEGLAYAIVFYAICMIGQFTVGQPVAARTTNWRGILRLPLLYATALGVMVSVLHLVPPPWLVNTISLIGGMTIPLMLLMLGASLARLRVNSVGKAGLLSAVRILAGAAIGELPTLIEICAGALTDTARQGHDFESKLSDSCGRFRAECCKLSRGADGELTLSSVLRSGGVLVFELPEPIAAAALGAWDAPAQRCSWPSAPSGSERPQVVR